jgi:aromatic-L-amino-acid/L-tryptophan decarboxylase
VTPEEFRRLGYATIDRVAAYWEGLEDRPVAPAVTPGQVRALLPALPPEHGEPFEDLLDDVSRILLPHLMHWQHPRFFGYFPANTSGPAVLADLLSTGLGIQGMSWITGPACTELEQHVLDWMVGLLGLPDRFRSDGGGGGVIQDTASSGLLVALVAALYRATGGSARHDGVGAGRYAVYLTAETHSGAAKAAVVAGLGEAALRYVRTDPGTQALDVTDLREQMARDVADGVTPLMTVATIGTTSTTAIDPVAAIGPICREHGAWLHVDAAYAGVAAICPELRWIHEGVGEYADSYCTNPHKWLLTSFDCDTFWVADRASLLGALTVLPEYLRNSATASGAVVDYRDWQIPLGRRFRALKLWAVIRWYGAEGLRRHIRAGITMAAYFAARAGADERFDLHPAYPLGLVCFRLRAGGDAVNQELLDRLNGSGRIFLSHARIGGSLFLRFAVGGTFTEDRHIQQAWDLIALTAEEMGVYDAHQRPPVPTGGR